MDRKEYLEHVDTVLKTMLIEKELQERLEKTMEKKLPEWLRELEQELIGERAKRARNRRAARKLDSGERMTDEPSEVDSDKTKGGE